MFGMIIQRYFHISKITMSVSRSSVLAKLRKSTGYPISNCKKAVELFPDDYKKAEEWLHAEAKSKGWSKWAKIQNRTAAQGLIGVCSQDNIGVMLEVNCETDFVAKNAEFQQIVEKMLLGCINYTTSLNVENCVTKSVLEETQLTALKCETSTLGELVAAATCKFNEKTVAKRAVCLKVKNGIFLSSLSHPAIACFNLSGASLGRYGVLLASKRTETDISEDTTGVELNICQHIIGMNPLSIGQLTDKDIEKFSRKSNTAEDSVCSENADSDQQTQADKAEVSEDSQSEVADDSSDEDQETVDTVLKDSDETELVFQPYLLDPDVTVGETLFRSGVDVVAFERFECGETIAESPDIVASAAA